MSTRRCYSFQTSERQGEWEHDYSSLDVGLHLVVSTGRPRLTSVERADPQVCRGVQLIRNMARASKTEVCSNKQASVNEQKRGSKKRSDLSTRIYGNHKTS